MTIKKIKMKREADDNNKKGESNSRLTESAGSAGQTAETDLKQRAAGGDEYDMDGDTKTAGNMRN